MIERVLDSSPPKAVTFLMSDVEGSTRMWERLPTPMRAAMARLDQIVESTVSGCNGQLLKQRGEGDSHFAVFGKASEAAETSVEIQKALAAEDWGELGHLRIRIAISTGEADHRDGDYYGPGVNRCARMRGAAHGGQILISHAVQQAIKDSLPFGCSVMNLGEHRFRDLLEPERVYQLLADGLPRDFPALKSIDASRNNLPVQLTSFIGREKEVSQLHTLLKKSRLVTLTGAGGCGKTRLGLQVAADFVNELDDGVWFVELVGLTDGRLISQTIAEAMHLSLTGDNPLESLLAELKDLSCMLVLDNCEHLVRDAAAVAARVLKECRRVKLFATSRERLAVTGEQVFLVPPLDCDLRGQDATLEHVAGLDSVKLLRERAASRTSDQILTEDSAAAVAQLCKRLDGIPLAIEQAASNLPYLSPAQILDRLEQHLSILATDEDDIDPRHRTLQATIDWSYEMLSAAEKLLFQRLAVFMGGWTLEAAEAICSTDGLERKEIFPLLQKLAGKSLVATELSSWGSRRYRLLEPIREYALAKRGDDPELHQRHFEWHQHLAHEAYEQGLDVDNGRWLHVLSDEHDNIRAALNWSIDIRKPGSEVLQTCIHLHRFWLRRGLLREGLAWFERTLDSSLACADVQADAMNIIGVFLWQLGRLSEAEAAITVAMDAWNSDENRIKEAAALNNLACLAFARTNLAQARERFGRVAVAFKISGDDSRLASALENLGITETLLSEYESAVDHLAEAADLHAGLGETSSAAKCRMNVLAAHAREGTVLSKLDAFGEVAEAILFARDELLLPLLGNLAARVALEQEEFEHASKVLGGLDAVWQESEATQPSAEIEFRDRTLRALSQCVAAQNLKSWLRKGKAEGLLSTLTQYVRQSQLSNGL